MTAASVPRRLRLSTPARRMLPWCVALALAMHGLLLAALAPGRPQEGGSPALAATRKGGVRSISVRLIPDSPVAAGVAAASAPDASVPSAAASGVPDLPKPASDAASAAALSASAASAPSRDVESSAVAAAGLAGELAPGGYLPRGLLSIAPAATAPVIIPTPGGSVELGRHVGVLALYIDEQGRVRRIEAEPPALPAAMEQAARETFMAAQFSPGLVDGHPVKSRIRVEVVFDDAPRSAAPPPSAASAASTPGPANPASAQASR